MKKFSILVVILALSTTLALAQAVESFDIISFKTPQGWQKQVGPSSVQIGTESVKGGMCLITMFKPIAAGSDPKGNFDASWQTIVKETFAVVSKPEMQPTASENGWIVESGFAQYENDGKKGIVLLVSASGNEKLANVLIITNTDEFQQTITEFLGSIVLPKVAERSSQIRPTAPQSISTANDQFATTKFEDGWVSVARSDWVEMTKGQIRVLLHYPKLGTIIAADPEPHTVNAWNILVAPRYSNIKDFKVVSPTDYQRAYFGSAFLTENQSGKQVYVSLFRKSGGWVEIIMPDKAAFIQNFGFDINSVRWDTSSDIFKPLSALENYNKFAISTNDFDGEWTDRFSSNTFYANIYTGLSEGMSSYSSSETFVFSKFRNYTWNLVAANSFQGRTSIGQGKGSGTFKVLGPWQINFSNIEGKPKTFNAYFSYIKGGKILWMINAESPGSGIYTGYGKSVK